MEYCVHGRDTSYRITMPKKSKRMMMMMIAVPRGREERSGCEQKQLSKDSGRGRRQSHVLGGAAAVGAPAATTTHRVENREINGIISKPTNDLCRISHLVSHGRRIPQCVQTVQTAGEKTLSACMNRSSGDGTLS